MKKLIIEGGIVLENGLKVPPISIFDTIQTIVRSPTNSQGVDYAEMASSIEIQKKLNTAKDNNESFILLETSEHKVIGRMLKAFKFAFSDPVLFRWIEEIINLPDINVKESDNDQTGKDS